MIYQIVGGILMENPKLEKDIITPIINGLDNLHIEKGREVLEKYGYNARLLKKK